MLQNVRYLGSLELDKSIIYFWQQVVCAKNR